MDHVNLDNLNKLKLVDTKKRREHQKEAIELHQLEQRARSSRAPTQDYLRMAGIPVRLPASRLNWKQKKPRAMWLALLGGKKLSVRGLLVSRVQFNWHFGLNFNYQYL